MVGLGEVDEFEVEAEGARELVSGREFEGVDAGEGLLKVGGSGLGASLPSASRRAMAVRRRASTAS